ncbi:cytochrome P450 [Micromonospora pisi]|uniref:Cytochrome P450 n=1 Tax=Micromonospora pisi TaxID=589240 RepID=A0A495JBW0_9ACTN|nr:cytochrome P450 [Micromonospora pisi]RKR86407.1 cytochrome P450 [Micromonospora pisi]
MSEAATGAVARNLPLRKLPGLVRHPLEALVEAGNAANGDIVRLGVGPVGPYLVTSPDHLETVLHNPETYVREGLLWTGVRRAVGEAILVTEGAVWKSSRDVLRPLFTSARVNAMTDRMAEAIRDAVDGLAEPAREGRTVDAGTELARIVCQATTRVLFGDKITVSDAVRMVDAFGVIATEMIPRIVVPWAPGWLPLPGDRAFAAAVATLDEIVLPLIREARRHPDGGDDIISALCAPREIDGAAVTEKQIRDDLVAMVSTSTETTIAVLSWLWPVLAAHQEVAEKLYAEIDRVVGGAEVRRSHLPELRYTRMVLDELLRLWPAGWFIPRMAVRDEVLGGTRIAAGSTILVSPYVTQRMRAFWSDPDDFDPERFDPDGPKPEPHYSYLPFGGGPHRCLGQYLFAVEAPLIIATILSRFRPHLVGPVDFTPRMGASLRPATEAKLVLRPVRAVVP